ncbi:MAG TPA: phosphotransferase [Blastocatellia bacterium]|nr:phosphotransferase [Blastocatellia bacterium]
MSATTMTEDLSAKRVRNYAARYLNIEPETVQLEALTPDASTRKYYRIAPASDAAETFIVSLYATPFNPQSSSYLDVTRLFEAANLPVPKVLDVAGTEGIILQEDLGDVSLAKWMQDHPSESEAKLKEAIELIARIQAASDLALYSGSIAGTLAFDEDKLGWELNYFFDHFFGSYRRDQLSEDEAAEIKADLQSIAAELSARPRVLTHRDYHAMNLMVDSHNALRIIDHQDARMGPATYDLVPILVERVLEPADETWVETHIDSFNDSRVQHGLTELAKDELMYEFHLMTVQRQLKATGTFSYQTAVVGRAEVYEKYIRPAIATVLRAMNKPGMKAYPALRQKLTSL